MESIPYYFRCESLLRSKTSDNLYHNPESLLRVINRKPVDYSSLQPDIGLAGKRTRVILSLYNNIEKKYVEGNYIGGKEIGKNIKLCENNESRNV